MLEATQPGALARAAAALRQTFGLTAAPLEKSESSTEIIGHPGQPGMGPGPTESPFGVNPADESSPTGQGAAELPSAAGIVAGSQATINRARARERQGGDSKEHTTDIRKSAGDRLLGELVAADGDGALREAIDVAPALERLVDSLAKSLDTVSGYQTELLNHQTELLSRLERLEALVGQQHAAGVAMTKSLAEGVSVLMEHGEQQAAELEKSLAAPVRASQPGVAAMFGLGNRPQTAPGTAPEGLTKSQFVLGLNKAVEAGKLSREQGAAVLPVVDASGLAAAWARIDEAARAFIYPA